MFKIKDLKLNHFHGKNGTVIKIINWTDHCIYLYEFKIHKKLWSDNIYSSIKNTRIMIFILLHNISTKYTCSTLRQNRCMCMYAIEWELTMLETTTYINIDREQFELISWMFQLTNGWLILI